MKKQLLKNLRLRAVMLVALLCAGISGAWGEEGKILFGSSTGSVKINAASVKGTDSQGYTWTITTEGTTSFTQNSIYSQVGSSKKPATSITFTTTLSESVTITNFKAKFGGFSETAGVVNLKVGDTNVGSGPLNDANDVIVSSTTSATGTVLTITVANIKKGVKVYEINYTYTTDGGDTPTPTGYTFTYDFSTGGVNNSSSNTNTWTTDFFTILQAIGNSTTPPANYLTSPRWYKGNTITFTPNENVIITQIIINCNDNNNGQEISASTGSITQNDNNSLWTGSIKSSKPLVLTMGKQCRPANIVVTYSLIESVTLNANGYATYASKNVLDFTNVTDYTAWAITAVSGNNIAFSQITGKVPAGTGVLLMGTAGQTVTLTSATGTATAPETNLLEGITEATTIEANTYYGLSGTEFVPVLAGTVPAGKALLPANVVGDVKSLNLVFNDETGIREVRTVNGEETTEIFNLAGQRLQKLQRGVNIVNGKKVLVK